ncbi:hypothetical protein MP228_000383 [Amoeboaphelidium protococcarum]|nr:hypothetical protein MP228_000383 [Amoeboaphelidium protococcarum]
MVKPNESEQSNPDSWVQRSEKLVKVTGEYPLNAETPIDSLQKDFITPTPLLYVRNHGAVPKLNADKHKLYITGLVERELTITLEQLINEFDSTDVTVTFNCDGFRRKELNMIKQSTGNNFSIGVISTATYTGVRLVDIIEKVGVKGGVKHVIMTGSDDLEHGNYETSIPFDHARDSSNEVLIAYKVNGEPLPPDHGYPMRMIVPGFVGGRQVKWLKRIIFSATDSENHYHLYDNKVFPPNIDSVEKAHQSGIFKDPLYILYEININSVITKPQHDETIDITSCHVDSEYEVSGFAYSGGGRPLQRVVLSLDEGRTWLQCQLNVNERQKSRWTWTFWSCKVPLWSLIRADYITVRAFDNALNTQPDKPIWNLMGMMNNCWYKVKTCMQPSDINGRHSILTFKHPVLPAKQQGGYLDKANTVGELRELSKKVPDKQFSWAEVKKHVSRDDCWLVIDNEVVDVSKFMKLHPGGGSPLMSVAGRDASSEFHSIHSMDAVRMKMNYVIGTVSQERESKQSQRQLRTPTGRLVALSPRKWTRVTLVEKERLSQDSFRFKFAFENRNTALWLPTGYHIMLGGHIHSKEPDELVTRPYTPVRPVVLDDEDGTFDLVIKIYYPHHNRPGGELTMALDKLQIGSVMEVKGPSGTILYQGDGLFFVNGRYRYAKRISLLGAGSGITPLLQVCTKVAKDQGKDQSELRMIYSNKTADDILCKQQIEDLQSQLGERFKVFHTITEQDKVPSDWTDGVGRLNKEMMRDNLYPFDDDTVALVCGPQGFTDKACIPLLEELGYDEDSIYIF